MKNFKGVMKVNKREAGTTEDTAENRRGWRLMIHNPKKEQPKERSLTNNASNHTFKRQRTLEGTK